MPAASILFSVALIRWVASLRLSIASSRMGSSLLAMLSIPFLLWPRLRQSGYNELGRAAMRIGEGTSPLPDPRRGHGSPVALPYMSASTIQGLPSSTCTSTTDRSRTRSTSHAVGLESSGASALLRVATKYKSTRRLDNPVHLRDAPFLHPGYAPRCHSR